MREYDASFDKLLVKIEEKAIDVQSLQILMIEVYKSLNHHNPSLLWELFARKKTNCNLKIKDILALPEALPTSFGRNSISLRGSIL